MEAGMDTGPVYLREELPVPPEATTGTLTPLLATLGARLLVETLAALAGPGLSPVPQEDGAATHAPRLKKEQGRLDFTRPAAELARQIRAFSPWPGTYFLIGDESVKVHCATEGGPAPPGTAPGEVLPGEQFPVACGDGRVLIVRTLQREGRRALPAPEVLRGFSIQPGTRL
jgi:methionyl-tRNA formyltransferase